MNKEGLKQKHSNRKRGSYWVVFTAAAVLLSGCSLGGASEASVQLTPREAATASIQKIKISEPIEQVAEVVAGTKLAVVPKVNGEVVQVLKKRGESVNKDDILFIMDSVDAESAVRKSELALRSARDGVQQAKDNEVNTRRDLQDNIKRAETAVKNAEEQYNKLRNEFDAGLAVERQVDLAKQQLDDAEMSLESVRNKLAAFERSNSVGAAETQAESAALALQDAKRMLEEYSVKAPGSGILTDFYVVEGQTVAAGAGPVGQVQQIDPIKIKTELTETQYKLVQGKQELVYYDPDTPDNKPSAKISYLAPIMSAETKTFTLELEASNADLHIQPGKRYMVQLTTDIEEEVLAIPILSIIREESDTFVFIKQGNVYEKRKVRLGRLNGEYQEVLEGVKEGEEIVISGQNALKDGQPVESASTATGTAAQAAE